MLRWRSSCPWSMTDSMWRANTKAYRLRSCSIIDGCLPGFSRASQIALPRNPERDPPLAGAAPSWYGVPPATSSPSVRWPSSHLSRSSMWLMKIKRMITNTIVSVTNKIGTKLSLIFSSTSCCQRCLMAPITVTRYRSLLFSLSVYCCFFEISGIS